MLLGLAPLAYDNIKKKNVLGCVLISASMCSFVIAGESRGSIVWLHNKGMKERRESATTATVHTQTRSQADEGRQALIFVCDSVKGVGSSFTTFSLFLCFKLKGTFTQVMPLTLGPAS